MLVGIRLESFKGCCILKASRTGASFRPWDVAMIFEMISSGKSFIFFLLSKTRVSVLQWTSSSSSVANNLMPESSYCNTIAFSTMNFQIYSATGGGCVWPVTYTDKMARNLRFLSTSFLHLLFQVERFQGTS